MFKKIRNWKLKKQLILLALIFNLLIVLLGSYLFWNINMILNKKIDASTEQVFSHIDMEIQNFIKSIESASNTIAYLQQVQECINSDVERNPYELYSSIHMLVNSVLLTNQNLISVILDLKTISLAFNDINVSVDQLKTLLPERNQTTFSKLLPYSDISAARPLYYFAAIRRINSINYYASKENTGYITFIISKSFFDEIASRYGITKNSRTYIISSNNEILGRNNSTVNDEVEAMVLENSSLSSSSTGYFTGGTRYIYHSREIGSTGWRVVSLTPFNEYFSELWQITFIVAMLFLFIMGTMLMFSVLITRNITSPIRNMLQTMENVKKGDLKNRCGIELDNEIGALSNHFNAMMDEVYTLTSKIFVNQQKLYESELAGKDARLIALQSQINPHFLYNALACIQGIALHYNIEEISKVVKALARIFRYSIKENNYVMLSAELENISSYVMIYQIKSSGKINYMLDIEPDILNCTIIKLLLQPIVENAVNHGLMKKLGNGTLLLKGHRSGKYLSFEVIDDGIGMPPRLVDRLNGGMPDTANASSPEGNSQSIGIMNVRQRLYLCYSRDYYFKVESSINAGTKVSIRVPCREGDTDDQPYDS